MEVGPVLRHPERVRGSLDPAVGGAHQLRQDAGAAAAVLGLPDAVLLALARPGHPGGVLPPVPVPALLAIHLALRLLQQGQDALPRHRQLSLSLPFQEVGLPRGHRQVGHQILPGSQVVGVLLAEVDVRPASPPATEFSVPAAGDVTAILPAVAAAGRAEWYLEGRPGEVPRGDNEVVPVHHAVFGEHPEGRRDGDERPAGRRELAECGEREVQGAEPEEEGRHHLRAGGPEGERWCSHPELLLGGTEDGEVVRSHEVHGVLCAHEAIEIEEYSGGLLQADGMRGRGGDPCGERQEVGGGAERGDRGLHHEAGEPTGGHQREATEVDEAGCDREDPVAGAAHAEGGGRLLLEAHRRPGLRGERDRRFHHQGLDQACTNSGALLLP